MILTLHEHKDDYAWYSFTIFKTIQNTTQIFPAKS